MTHHSCAALGIHFVSADCSQTGSGRSSLMQVEFWKRREVVTDEQEYLPSERVLAACYEEANGAQTMIDPLLDGRYRVKSVQLV